MQPPVSPFYLKSKDLYKLSPPEKALFFQQKELVYAERRELVNHYCNVIRTVYDPGRKSPLMNIQPHCILYDEPDGIAHCSIAKVF